MRWTLRSRSPKSRSRGIEAAEGSGKGGRTEGRKERKTAVGGERGRGVEGENECGNLRALLKARRVLEQRRERSFVFYL
jgi:hypothetical protein